MIYHFFKPNDNYTETQLRALSKAVDMKLNRHVPGKNCNVVIDLLAQRKSAFEYHLAQSVIPAEKQQFINAYYVFIKCIDDCLTETKHQYPGKTTDLFEIIQAYYHSPHYLRTGGLYGEHTKTACDQVASGLIGLSLTILASSLAISLVSFPVALALIALSITVLAPSLFYAVAETHPHEAFVQNQEATLFSQLNTVINYPNSELEQVISP